MHNWDRQKILSVSALKIIKLTLPLTAIDRVKYERSRKHNHDQKANLFLLESAGA
jgi:hypothetical protein